LRRLKASITMDFDDIPEFMPGSTSTVEISEKVKGVLRIPKFVNLDGKPECIVLIPPGNPARHLGNAHAGHPLFVALEEACFEADLATLRFDYHGIGMSIEGGEDPSKWEFPAGGIRMFNFDSWDAYRWAKANVCENVEVVGYSMSSGFALEAALRQMTKFYIALSVAPLVHKWLTPDEKEQEEIRKANQIHKTLDMVTFFAVGRKDPMSPEDEMRPWIDERPDKGAKVTFEILEDGDHSFKGCEDSVAGLTAKWLKGQLEALPANDSA